MPNISLWLTVPKGPFAAVLTAQAVNTSTGDLSDTTNAWTLTSDADEIDFGNEPVLTEVSPMNAGKSNNVLLQDNASATITEILKSAGVNKLAAANALAEYFKLVYTRGGQAYTFYGVRGPYSETVRRDRSTASLTLLQIDPNTTNPAYA